MISIVVDNYNRAYLLPLLMSAYDNMLHNNANAEMIIVDDASDKENFAEAVRYAYDVIVPWFRVRAFEIPLHEAKMNCGKTLNVAVKQSKGDIILFNHSDMFPLNIVWGVSLIPFFVASDLVK